MPRHNLILNIKNADVQDFPCDVLVLKYAQGFHGADLSVAKKLGLTKLFEAAFELKDGDFKLIPGDGRLGAETVLFEGVVPLAKIDYAKIRKLCRSAILHVHESHPDTRHIAMTMHGVNFGMDEKESFMAQIAGVYEALEKEHILPELKEISFVEKNQARAFRLSEILQEYSTLVRSDRVVSIPTKLRNAGGTKEKPHVFVAMPFSPEMEDVYIFGIQGPVQEAGYLCERVDMDIFTGDIVERIKSRIATAKFIIADLSGANANVYLEVGYAWGSKVTTLLICRNVNDLKFDVKGQRCLVYSSINDLNKKLSLELSRLVPAES